MTSERIEELMKQTAYPESHSVHQAMLQLWNEMEQDFNSRVCENCDELQPEFSNTCALGIAIPDDWDGMSDLTFGCNSFFRKEK